MTCFIAHFSFKGASSDGLKFYFRRMTAGNFKSSDGLKFYCRRVTGWNSIVVEGRVEVLFSSNDGLKLQVLEIPEVLRLHTTTERIIGCRLYSRVLTDVQKAIVVIRLNSDWLRNLRQLILEYNHLGCYWIQNTQLLDFTVLRILALDISKISGRRYSNEFEYRLWLVYL